MVASFAAAEVIPLETMRNRYIAPAAVSVRGIFNVPGAVSRHLGLQVTPRADSEMRGTDDQVVWFLPAPEYYEYRALQRLKRPWTGPSTGGFAHVYLSRAILPIQPELFAMESAIESEEWKPRREAMARANRARRSLR